MININVEKAMENFCKKHNICPNREEKILLQLAIHEGIALKIQENIKQLEDGVEDLENKTGE